MTDARVQLYQRFLSSPQASYLAPDAKLTYVTSCRTFNGPDAIVSHLLQASRQHKRAEEIMSAHAAADSIVLETVTTIEFVNGTGAYVQGLDKNFVVDNTVVVPIIHSVIFENEQVKSIRFFWDQGAMLKQLNIIGTRGNIWPIFNGADQKKLMAADATPSGVAPAATNPAARKHFEISELEPDLEVPAPRPGAIETASSAKPKPRNLQDLMDSSAAAPASPHRMGSAPKTYDIFDEKNQTPIAHRQMKGPAPVFETPEQIRAKRNFNAKNFEPHFKFGTPETALGPYSKTRSNMHPQPDELKWDHDAEAADYVQPTLGNGRRDMSNTFEIRDESPAPKDRFGGIKIAGNGMGSKSTRSQFNINMMADEEEPEQQQYQRPLAKHLETSAPVAHAGGIKIAGNGMGSKSTRSQFNINMMAGEQEQEQEQYQKPLVEQPETTVNARRASTTASTAPAPKAETEDLNNRFRGIKIAGNGMGSRGQRQWSWDMNPEEEEQQQPASAPAPAATAARKQAEHARYQPRMTSHRQFNASWSFGEDEDDKENN
ncbi:hypothetical protein BZA70DRAFT_275231 [Myxozyma melibiosi]|uniref:NTF2 domain-containing protein n=1 Tax=Myxozyma melibiosi TaxID=54550 RepID=A0ABR1FAL1_9ASCO